nr:hypothetical protein LSAT_2X106500 [Ipomoea batatas]GMC48767.1 hypothetical protein LSAT_2X106500 [Ipomoea batatas]GMC50965.1 hypothetical protein LSAT_2X106500 [Ipomoea batatas]GMC56601.1 hypothetical protein LSAT_2X106500 [Ipomoea batatas]GME01750.1 hypothetical protein LSAT_2X106500 [Ipomoea batatas]
MGYVIVISLPVIILFIVTAVACYLIGRKRSRDIAAGRYPQHYGPPAPPPAVMSPPPPGKGPY